MSAEHRDLDDAIRRHLPEGALERLERFFVIASRSAAGHPMFVVEAYDREFQPLKANIGTSDGESVEIRVRYDDGRWHVERWVDRTGEIVDGHHNRPELWAAGLRP